MNTCLLYYFFLNLSLFLFLTFHFLFSVSQFSSLNALIIGLMQLIVVSLNTDKYKQHPLDPIIEQWPLYVQCIGGKIMCHLSLFLHLFSPVLSASVSGTVNTLITVCHVQEQVFLMVFLKTETEVIHLDQMI